MSSMPCRKWCFLCLHDGSEHELFDVFSVSDLRERVEEEYEIQIKEGNGSPKICIQCFQETLIFRKQRKSYEADKERVLKKQKQLESQLVRGGREKTSSRLRSIPDETLTLIPNARTEKVSTPSHKESSSKKSYHLSIDTKRNDRLSSGVKQNSSQKIKSKENTNSTSESTNAEKNTASKLISGHDTSDSQKRNNGSMTKDGITTSGPNSKSTLENRKRVRFSINDDTLQDCLPTPQKKLKFSESSEKSDASAKNQGQEKSRDKKLSNNREQPELQLPKGPDWKKDEPKKPAPLSNISGSNIQSAEKTVTKPTTDKNSLGPGLNQHQQSINSTHSRQPSDLHGSGSKKATSLKESKKSTSTYSGLKIKIQLGKQKNTPSSSGNKSSKSSSNGTKKKTPDDKRTKVSTSVNVGASAPSSIQAKTPLVPIISGPTRSIDLVPENNQLNPVPAMNTPSFPVATAQILPRPTNDRSIGESQLQPVSVANTPTVVVPIGQILSSSKNSFTSGESQPNTISVASTPSVVVPIAQIQTRYPNNPVLGDNKLRQITVANTVMGVVPIGQHQISNTAATVAVSRSFNSTPAISNIYSSATVPPLPSLVHASNPPPLIDLNQNISRGDVSAPVLVSKPASISSTSAETNPTGSSTLTSLSPWQPSNVSTITSCPIVTPVSGKLQQRSNITVTTTALPVTTVASPVLPLTTVASPVMALTTVVPPPAQATTSVIAVSSHQKTTTTSVVPAVNTDGQLPNVGIKKRRHSTFIRVSTNLFDEPDAQFASLRNNLFVRNNEQATTSSPKAPLILNRLLHSTTTAPGQTSLPIRTQANNSYQSGISSGGLLFSHVSSQLQPTRINVHDESTIPVHVLYKTPNNRPQSTISNRSVAQNQNPPPRQVMLNQRMKVPAIQTAAASSANPVPTYTVIPLSGSNPTTRAVQITPRMPIATQTTITNATTNKYFIVKQGTTGNAVSTTNNNTNVLPTGAVRTSTATTTDVNLSVQNAPWNSVNCVTNPPQHRPILMCQLCAEFFLTEPLMGQHLNQVHFVEFSRSLFSTVYDESIRKLLVARARRKSIATPDDLRSER